MKAETQEPGVLTTILAETAARMESRAEEVGEWQRLAAKAQPAPSFAAALRKGSVAVIAEVKRRSPSAGTIRADTNVMSLARSLADGGAVAISVLTEAAHFGGSLEDLMQVARSVGIPTLRKDFIIDPIQVYEAKAAGAAAILLIVRALTDERLEELATLARNIGLDLLVEVHTANELARAVAVQPTAIGVNARDLDTLAMDSALVTSLLPQVPAGILRVAESGLTSRADIERVAAAGADAVLVGAAVSGAEDPTAAVRELTGVPRTPR